MTHADLCRRSAEAHIRSVERVLPGIRAPAPRVLARALLETTRNALREGAALDAGDVKLRLGLVNAALHNDAAATSQLLNQSSLGLGYETPLVVFVGKEAAFEPKQDRVNFLLESIALAVLWLCDGSDRVMQVLLESPISPGANFYGTRAR